MEWVTEEAIAFFERHFDSWVLQEAIVHDIRLRAWEYNNIAEIHRTPYKLGKYVSKAKSVGVDRYYYITTRVNDDLERYLRKKKEEKYSEEYKFEHYNNYGRKKERSLLRLCYNYRDKEKEAKLERIERASFGDASTLLTGMTSSVYSKMETLYSQRVEELLRETANEEIERRMDEWVKHTKYKKKPFNYNMAEYKEERKQIEAAHFDITKDVWYRLVRDHYDEISDIVIDKLMYADYREIVKKEMRYLYENRVNKKGKVV